MDPTYVKVTIIGDKNVGKSTILLALDDGASVFNPDRVGFSTGSEFVRKTVTVNRRNFTLGIWDTTGLERFDSLTYYLKDVQVVIYVYDITNKESFHKIEKYRKTAEQDADPRLLSFLVGNKSDLLCQREVMYADAERYANEHDMTFLECSAVLGLNVSKLFEKMKRGIVRRRRFESPIFDDSTYDILELIDVVANHETRKKRRGLCKVWK